MELIDNAYRTLVWGAVVFLSLLLCGFLIRAMIGPRFTDRVVAINVICAKAIILIVLLSFLYQDYSYLDIAIVYSMISFVAVVVLSKCFNVPPAEKDDNVKHETTNLTKEAAE